jgi:AraC-like DNA-binding protein
VIGTSGPDLSGPSSFGLDSYGFRYTDGIPGQLYYLNTIGRESVNSPKYRWHGLSREGPGLLFQYTLSGEGQLEVSGQRYRIPKHHGFWVSIPSDHCYWYEAAADSSTPWEFVWVKLQGYDSAAYWERFLEHFGPAAYFHPGSDVVQLLKKLLNDTSRKTLGDKYQTSVRLYEWLLAISREVNNDTQERIPETEQSDVLKRVKEWLNEHLYEPQLGLDRAAEVAGISKYHLCKVFQASLGVTPMNYVRHLRLEEAARLLRQTALPITEIAVKAGFSNVSYFGKVFRHVVGVSPSQFRNGEGEAEFGVLRIM